MLSFRQCGPWCALKTASLVLLLMLTLSRASTVRAHAQLERAEPRPDTVLAQAPERLQLWFTEALEPGFSDIQVLDANGQRVDRGDSRVASDNAQAMTVSLPPLDKGVYTVAWKTLSQVDGHTVRGTYSLLIGVEPSTVPPLIQSPDTAGPAVYDAPIRWLGYLGATVLVGLLLFLRFVLEPTIRRQRLTGLVLPAIQPRLRLLLWLAWVALLVSTLATLVFQALTTTDVGGAAALATLGPLVTSTRFGYVWLGRLAAVVALAILVRLYPQRPGVAAAIVVVTSGVLLTHSLNSHSAAIGALAFQAMLIDWLHFMGVSVWVGGLAGLAFLLPVSLYAISPSQRWPLLGRLIPRFSSLAVMSVAVLAASGVYLAYLHVGSVDALQQTLYGRSLLIKLGLFAILIALGAFNLLIVSPALAAAVGSRAEALSQTGQVMPRMARLGGRFIGAVRVELGLAVLALLAAGAMTSLSPAKQTYERIQATRPLEMSTPVGDMRATLTIAPGRPGFNNFTLRITDNQGRPVDDAERVDLRFTFLGEDLGTNVQVAEPQGYGQYGVRGGFVGVEGRWQTEALIRRPGQDDARTAFRFVVTPTSATADTAGQTAAGSPPSMPMIIVGAVLAALTLGGLAVYVARTSGLRSPAGAATGLVTLALVCLGGFLVIQAQPSEVIASGDIKSVRNPIPPTQESIALGQKIYQAECLVCHGARGRGDGPGSVALNPKPADFRVHMAAGHTDGELFFWLSDGVAGTAMVGFKDKLSVTERWHVINFIKTFAPVAQ